MTLHVHRWGDPAAPAVVCVHGIGGHGRRFRRLAEERLLPRFAVVAVDLRGHGRSTWEPPWRIEQHAEDLLEVVAALGLTRPAWVGHSFGGRLVLELAARHPAVVGRGVLLDPAVWIPPPMALRSAEDARQEASWATREEALAYLAGREPRVPAAVLAEEADEHLVRGEDGRLRLRRCAGAVVAGLAELAVHPPLEQLRDPLLLVRGTASEVVPEVLADALAADFPHAFEVVTVPGGHSVLWESFDETADAVAGFLGA